jgi:GNAT superfamily N-acetyltransferase
MDTNRGEQAGALQLSTHPLTEERWSDLEQLFGRNGACGGCWCMWWVVPRKQFDAQKGDANKAALRGRVASGEVPGLIGYLDGAPVAWCAVQPRTCYPVLERSRSLGRVDAAPVWSIVCLFIARPFRRRGLGVQMIGQAVAHARRGGAPIVEAYPVVPKAGRMPDAFAWTGVVAAYEQAGFVEVAAPSATRRIMRYYIAA